MSATFLLPNYAMQQRSQACLKTPSSGMLGNGAWT
jgi:hypothetical protein